MRYTPNVSTSPTTPPAVSTPVSALTPAVRRTVHDLHAAAAGRAWAVRLGRSPAMPALPEARADAAGDAADAERLVGLLAALRAETTRYTCALRAEGARPEQMLVRVKALVRQAMAAEGWCDPEATQALTADVVGWSINAYYDR